MGCGPSVESEFKFPVLEPPELQRGRGFKLLHLPSGEGLQAETVRFFFPFHLPTCVENEEIVQHVMNTQSVNSST